MSSTLYNIGTRVEIDGFAAYGKFPSEGKGTVIRVRRRYVGSASEYTQYQVHLDGTDRPNSDLDYLYDEHDVKQI